MATRPTRPRSQNLARLKDLFPDWPTGKGIFSLLTNMPWTGVYDSIVLDIEYFGNHSGNKFCAPLLYHYIDADTTTITDEGRTILASVITAKYAKVWKQLWDTYDLEYSPLDNLNVQETLSRTDNHNLGGDETDNTTRTMNTQIGVNHGLKTTQESSSSNKTDSGTFGFNSTESVPSDTESQSGTVNSTVSNSGTDTTSNTGTIGDARSKTRNLTDNEIENWTKTKTGRTFADLPAAIAASRSLWLDDFFSKVFDDVDLVMTVPVYDDRGDDFEFEWNGSGGGGDQPQYTLPVASLNILGGVRGPNKTDQTLPVYVDENGFLFVDRQASPYVLPVASANTLGGVKLPPATDLDTEYASIDSDGFVRCPTGSQYVLPQASNDSLGGVKAILRSDETVSVAIDSDGMLWVPDQGASVVECTISDKSTRILAIDGEPVNASQLLPGTRYKVSWNGTLPVQLVGDTNLTMQLQSPIFLDVKGYGRTSYIFGSFMVGGVYPIGVDGVYYLLCVGIDHKSTGFALALFSMKIPQ